MITIYSRPSCAPCRTLKYWLDKKGHKYEVKDVDEHREEVLRYSSAPIVPITVIGDKVIEGMNLGAIADALRV